MNLTEHITPGGPLLEVLRRTEASLRDEPYDFADWTRCTCGHVYTAATGSWATGYRAVIYSKDVTFLQVAHYIAKATGDTVDDWDDIDTLSNRTIDRAKANREVDNGDEPTNDELRAAALQLIRTAITTCEAEQLAAMRAVADEAQRVVSLVDVVEGVLA